MYVCTTENQVKLLKAVVCFCVCVHRCDFEKQPQLRATLCQLNVLHPLSFATAYSEEVKVKPLFAYLPTLFGPVAFCLNSIIQVVKG